MKQYLGDHNYRASSFVFRDEESYYDFKVGNVMFPSDFDTYEKMHGEVITYRIDDLKDNK